MQKYPQEEMGIRNKLTVKAHMKELNDFIRNFARYLHCKTVSMCP